MSEQMNVENNAEFTEQDPAEPVALDFGDVAHQTVERELRGGHGSALAACISEPLALEQQRGTVELEPGFEHLPLAQDEGGLSPARVIEILDHSLSMVRSGSRCQTTRRRRRNARI